MNILITGAGGGSGIYSIKVLKETTDHYVIGADASPYSAGLFLADEGYVFPVARQQQAFLDRVHETVIAKDIDVIIPNVDEELPLFARPDVQSTLGAKVIVSPLETILICASKQETIRRLESVVPCPRTLSGGDDLSGIAFPVHIKPDNGRGSRHTYIVEDAIALEECFRQLEKHLGDRRNILIQEYLPGTEYTVDVLCDLSGTPLVVVPRVRLKTSAGLSIQGRTIRHTGLIENVYAIAKSLAFHGPVNMQFREDVSGVPRLLEINPRFSGGLPIVCAAGANTPALLLELLQNRPIEWPVVQQSWREGIVLRYLEEFFIPWDEWQDQFTDS
ncbi:MAG TPA: ATP-grasp domain-containing protein [bacterium]|nr:ATP-grasp domain-containing protein [bacterium]